MTQTEWDTTDDAKAMMDFVNSVGPQPFGGSNGLLRKRRMFCVRCRNFHRWGNYGEEGDMLAAKEAGRLASLWAGESVSQTFPIPKKVKADLIRDIFGSPFTAPHVTGPNNPRGCLRCTEYPVLDIAVRPPHPMANYTPIDGGRVWYAVREMYVADDFSCLGVVADMLEDADAANRHVLDHLRSPGPHVRGCWAVDLILGGKVTEG